ncbi:MAG: DUF4340 domain-containing protein [Elusimicrobia bacterium]|nr:DUF4340 domain-containing protein [Elusimicrobiota bacterium]
MHPRTLKRLAAAAAVLAAVLAVLVIRERSAAPSPPLLANAASVGKLFIQRPGDAAATILVREPGGWRLKAPFEYPADGEAVQKLLDAVSKASASDVLSSDPEKHASFQVNESSAIRFKAFSLPTDAEPALDILAGIRGADFDAFFYRGPASADVREARGLGRYELDKESGEWADRLLCAIEPPLVRFIELRTKSGALTLTRKDALWLLNGSALSTAAVAGKVEPLLAALARLQADKVAPEKGFDPLLMRGLADPELRLKVRHAPQAGSPDSAVKTTAIDFGPKAPDFVHYARAAGTGDVVFRLSAWRLDPFKLKPSDFR